ncbi:cupredoxin domain-containing protein [Kaarinaea lacus]
MNKIKYQMAILLVMLIAASCVVSAQAKDITIGQKNKTFILDDKAVEAITVNTGDTIHFMNNDPWFHNIFSLTQAKTFDLGSYPQGESRPVTFDAKGTFEVECAIHPNMFLEVTVK